MSDDRFEVTADGTLKLKDGKHLDYTKKPSPCKSTDTTKPHPERRGLDNDKAEPRRRRRHQRQRQSKP
ncbi:hypothetical protein ACF3OJ_08680 [Cardiobacterium hominis]|uniref:hypothetical protein n=1 Tax=Cardiobacterium hominis TaxID=2718 RepID=UPI00370DB78B